MMRNISEWSNFAFTMDNIIVSKRNIYKTIILCQIITAKCQGAADRSMRVK